jgi:hypothetical protein
MSDVHARILSSAETMYAGALSTFEAQKYWWTEMTAGAAFGAASFLTVDPETPEEIRFRADLIRKQAADLMERSRVSWVRRETEHRMQGTGRKSSKDETRRIEEFVLSLISDAIL